jgi:NADPH:quinone reductase-like Zn-dependent oxidoreductase
MKAFCASKYGSMDYFAILEIAKPAPKEDQVLVKVYAVSINDWDWADLDRSIIMSEPRTDWRAPGCHSCKSRAIIDKLSQTS